VNDCRCGDQAAQKRGTIVKLLTTIAAACLLLASCAPPPPAETASAPVATVDPPRDPNFPAANRQLLISSHGAEMNALFFLAAGEGPKPTLLLLHGLPGNERNLDLAQAIRRAGWNVLTFTYRGAWGSEGVFSIANSVEDAEAAIAFLRTPEAAQIYRIDTNRIVVAGHSMGGFASVMAAADDDAVAGIVLLDAWNVGVTADEVRQGGSAARTGLVAGFDDLGHALEGATAETLADEVIHSSDWDLRTRAQALAARPLLVVYASEGIAADNRALVTAVQEQPGARVHVVEIESDHSFADHRIGLSEEVVRWLTSLSVS
jgi:uncharacterized protein